ncbi:MAG TPA: hypothetical protein VLN49_09900 [Gemmatimonadaceae bacterium]|nr:hypothetical protein [Gemmatimonadaceae bacterium]
MISRWHRWQRTRYRRRSYASVASFAFVGVTLACAGVTPLLAQSGSGTSADTARRATPDWAFVRGGTSSPLEASIDVRGWPTVTGNAQGLALGLGVNEVSRWGTLLAEAAAANTLAQTASLRRGPRILDGRLAVRSPTLRIGGFGADATVGLTRDAYDAGAGWAQRAAEARIWVAGGPVGTWIEQARRAPWSSRSTPTSSDTRIGAWWSDGARSTVASLRAVTTGRLAVIEADSSNVVPGTCRVDYDALRTYRQYRSTCLRRFRSLDVEVVGGTQIGLAYVRLVMGARLEALEPAHSPTERWAGVRLGLPISRDVLLEADAVRQPSDIVLGTPPHTRFAAGFRLRLGNAESLRRDGASDSEQSTSTESVWASTASVMALAVSGDSVWRVRVRAAARTAVAVRGDFSAWRPVALAQVERGLWEVTLRTSAGPHTLAVQRDDGPWEAPPGLPYRDDGFGGLEAVLMFGQESRRP